MSLNNRTKTRVTFKINFFSHKTYHNQINFNLKKLFTLNFENSLTNESFFLLNKHSVYIKTQWVLLCVLSESFVNNDLYFL